MGKECGDLLVTAKQQKFDAALQPVGLSEMSKDKMLHFGSTIMMVSHKAEGFLAVNPFETIPKMEMCRPVTCSPSSKPSVRNTFKIVRANAVDGFGKSEVVHYGQKFYLAAAPFANITETHYLFSEGVSPSSASKISRKQEVVIAPRASGECLWQLLWPDAKEQFELDSTPVCITAPVCFRHVHTGTLLASDKIRYQNMFGNEDEVHCHNYMSTNKTQNLTSEMKGQTTGDQQLRRSGLENAWTIVTAEWHRHERSEQA